MNPWLMQRIADQHMRDLQNEADHRRLVRRGRARRRSLASRLMPNRTDRVPEMPAVPALPAQANAERAVDVRTTPEQNAAADLIPAGRLTGRPHG